MTGQGASPLCAWRRVAKRVDANSAAIYIIYSVRKDGDEVRVITATISGIISNDLNNVGVANCQTCQCYGLRIPDATRNQVV